MKKILLFILLFTGLFSNAQIYSENVNGTGSAGAPYKLDVDNDGVKDFWLSVVDYGSTTASGVYVITGKNGNKLEAETGVEANRLESGNVVGNNIWTDSVVLVRKVSGSPQSGNFAGSNYQGYVGFQFKKGVDVYYGWLQVNANYDLNISAYGYNTISGGTVKAGQKDNTTGINETRPQLFNVFASQNSINVSFSNPSEIKSVTIYDLNGNVLHKQTEISRDISINMVNNASGIFIIESSDINGNSQSVKVSR